MTYQVLSVNDSTNAGDLFLQVDGRISRVCHGNPNGAQLAVYPGVFAWDIDNGLLYMCTATDGTLVGSIWVVQDVTGAVPATTSVAGIAALATSGEVAAGIVNNKIVTPFTLAANYIKAGIVSTITQITGMTTPLTIGQGGTGVNSLANFILALFPSMAGKMGYVLSNDGAGNLSWVLQSVFPPVFPIVSQTLAVGTFVVCQVDIINLTLPPAPNAGETIKFNVSSGMSSIVLLRNGLKIMGLTQDMTIDQGGRFSLIYTGASNGWWLA